MVNKTFLLACLFSLLFIAPALAASAMNQGAAGTVPFLDATQGVGDAAATGMAFKLNGTEMMRVTATGSVGIGTTTPSTTLQVTGTVTASAFSGPGSVPSGAVMAFNLAACPTGWSAFTQAAGRAVIGVGQGNTAEGGGIGTNRTLLSTGGAETHKLTIAEMPSHQHRTYDAVNAGGGNVSYQSGNGLVNGINGTTYSYTAGGDAAHTIMPPFVALLYCQKN